MKYMLIYYKEAVSMTEAYGTAGWADRRKLRCRMNPPGESTDAQERKELLVVSQTVLADIRT
jgi:hypothetical protein